MFVRIKLREMFCLQQKNLRSLYTVVSETFAIPIFVTEVTIGFEQINYSVNEGNVIEVCAVLTGKLEKSLEVFVNSSSGNATGNKCSPKVIINDLLGGHNRYPSIHFIQDYQYSHETY